MCRRSDFSCGVTAMEGGPLVWVATHRKHHQFADKDGDPHSPRDGKWWSYAGWILMGDAFRQDVATLKRYVPDLAEDKFHVWLTEWHLTPTIILGLVLFAIALQHLAERGLRRIGKALLQLLQLP